MSNIVVGIFLDCLPRDKILVLRSHVAFLKVIRLGVIQGLA